MSAARVTLTEINVNRKFEFFLSDVHRVYLRGLCNSRQKAVVLAGGGPRRQWLDAPIGHYP